MNYSNLEKSHLQKEKAQITQKEKYNKNIKINKLKIGNKVLVAKSQLKNIFLAKLEKQFIGPYIIYNILLLGVYKLRTFDSKKVKDPVYENRLKLYFNQLINNWNIFTENTNKALNNLETNNENTSLSLQYETTQNKDLQHEVDNNTEFTSPFEGYKDYKTFKNIVYKIEQLGKCKDVNKQKLEIVYYLGELRTKN
ncbi:18_t:CDS:2 [Scutellospora calospora]|uniref:18_t:CDS:1 n=1 Tax=Scutellospora calospora TaxID=85575 RepID=A0ACA9KMU6_9GLOM|nr:18_t:CDS:2 [Scutellospora calospora]